MRIASIIAFILIALSANAQRQRIANLELSPDTTEAWAIFTDTNGVQTYVKWDSVLFDIYKLDSSAISIIDTFANSLSFNTSNGILTIGRSQGAALTEDIDGRYALQTTTITAGTGLSGGGDLSSNRTIDVGAGDLIDVNLNDIDVDLTELIDMTATMVSTDEFVVLDNGTLQRRKAANEIGLSIFNNNAGFITGNQTITISGDASGSGTTSIGLTINSAAVEASMLNNNIISGRTALTSGLLSTDEMLISDAGTVKRMDISVLETYMQNNLTFGGEWTDKGSFLHPNENGDDVVIGASSQGAYASELEVNGEGTFYGGTSGELIRVVNNSNQERFSVSYNSGGNYSAVKTASSTDTWYHGTNNSGNYYISDGLPTGSQEFQIESDGDLVLHQYRNNTDDVGIGGGPENHAYFTSSGVMSVAPIAKSRARRVTSGTRTLDGQDCFVHVITSSSAITLNLPIFPSIGQRYYIRYNVSGSGQCTLNGNGNNIRDENNAIVSSKVVTFRANDIVVYDGIDWVLFL